VCGEPVDDASFSSPEFSGIGVVERQIVARHVRQYCGKRRSKRDSERSYVVAGDPTT
jgi:hypothetical protein